MALPSLSGLALRAHAPAHTGAGERKRGREDECAEIRQELEKVRGALLQYETVDSAIQAMDRVCGLLGENNESAGDYSFMQCILDVLMENLYSDAVMAAAHRYASNDPKQKEMSRAALELLADVSIHCSVDQKEHLVADGCVTLGMAVLRERTSWVRSDRLLLESVVILLHETMGARIPWPNVASLSGVKALWELLKDEDVTLEMRQNVAEILQWTAKYAENGKFRVYEHGDLDSWDTYVKVMDDIRVAHTRTHGCDNLARTLTYPPEMRALLEAHPNLYDEVARMREDAKSCWSRFDDATKAAIDAMLGSRGYQMAAALSSHAPSLVAAVALAKTLHGEAEAAIDDYKALIASSNFSLAPPAQDLVAATVEQAAQGGKLATLRDSVKECQTLLERVATNEGEDHLLQQVRSRALWSPIVRCVHRAAEGVYKGYERVKDIPLLIHRLSATHDPFPNDPYPLGGVTKELRKVLEETERRVAEGPYMLHELDRVARAQPGTPA